MANFKIGDKVRIVDNFYLHNIPIGSIKMIDVVDDESFCPRACYIIDGYYLTSEEIELYEVSIISKNLKEFSFI